MQAHHAGNRDAARATAPDATEAPLPNERKELREGPSTIFAEMPIGRNMTLIDMVFCRAVLAVQRFTRPAHVGRHCGRRMAAGRRLFGKLPGC